MSNWDQLAQLFQDVEAAIAFIDQLNQLAQLFQVNFITSLLIWIVRLHLHIRAKVTKGKIVVQDAQRDEVGAPPMPLASIQVSSFCQPLQCTVLISPQTYLTIARPWRL